MRNQLVEQLKARPRVFMMICLVLAVVFVLFMSRIWGAMLLRYQTNQAAVTMVSTIIAKSAPTEETLVLPGNVWPWHEAPIYARTNGYIKKWYVDIGDQVKEGQLLATIETPELDAQLRQAEADLTVVTANNALAQSTAQRWVALLKTDSVSKQETDEKVNGANALAASVAAARANRDRLQELVSFERVTAPFSGTISARSTDIGALINAGSSPNAKPLFNLVQDNPLRIYVKIPQNYAYRIKPKMMVYLEFAERPGQQFPATLLQTASAINPTTRTLLAQFKMNNAEGKILPGGYAEVHFKMPSVTHAVRLPVNTLLFRAEGIQVATLTKDHTVLLKSVTISRDFGKEVQINSGIQPGEQIILNPPDSIMNGETVKVR